jgi:hypothetical protein
MKSGKVMKLLFWLLLVLSLPLVAEKVGEIRELLKNPHLTVAGDRFYITNDNPPFINIYSLKDCKHIGQFGRQGQGPAEIEGPPWKVDVQGNSLLIEDGGKKLILLTRDGVMQKEMKISLPHSFTYRQLGSNFICGVSYIGPLDAIVILDPKLKEMKTIAENKLGAEIRMDINVNRLSGISKINPFPDCFRWDVWQDKVFVGDTRKGFYFSVHDQKGKLLYEINKPYEKLPVTSEAKKMVLDRNKKGPGKSHFRDDDFLFPENFPAYHYFYVTDERIYVLTWKRINGKNEILILDLKGNLLARKNVSFSVSDLDKGHVGRGAFYYLKDNEEKECWELHAERLF